MLLLRLQFDIPRCIIVYCEPARKKSKAGVENKCVAKIFDDCFLGKYPRSLKNKK